VSPEPTLSAAVEAALAGEVFSPGVINVNFSAGAHRLRAPGGGGAFWNNIDGHSGAERPLRDSSGEATPARLTFEAASAYAEFSSPKTLNRAVNRLYRAGLVGDDTVSEVRVSLTDVPFPLYGVFVFASADSSDRSPLSISDGRTTFYYRSAGRDNGRATRLLRTRSEQPQAPTEGPAQYQVFAARAGPTFTLLTGGSRNGVLSNNVFGLQVVRAAPAEGGAMGEARREVARKRGVAAEQPPRSEILIPFERG
jgi:hypothetical protein